MPNIRQQLSDRFIVLPKEGIVQAAFDTPVDDADITLRLKCQISRTLEVTKQELRDCRDRFIYDRLLRSRLSRLTLTVTAIDEFWIAYFTALQLGTAAAPTGTPANEVQTITDGGTAGTLSMTLEGRTVTTQTIPTGSTAAQIQSYLTAPRMLFIQPGDVVITGTGPFTATFPDTGRLGRANLPTMSGSGGFSVAADTNGDQNFHAFSLSTSNTKQLISFCLGWDGVTNRVEKYINFAVESITPTLSLDGDVQFVINLIGMWGYNDILTSFSIPACNNIKPMPVSDCRLQINSVWQTTDINNLTMTVTDNIPTDRQSMFGFDGIDPQQIRRGVQPKYTMDFGIFGSEVDSLYQLAYDERTQATVAVKLHFGMPGHRCSWNFDYTKLALKNDPIGEAGALRQSVLQIEGEGFSSGANPPFDAEAYTGQAVAFLLT